MKTVDDSQFQTESSRALDDLYKRLNQASDAHDFEADFNAGALTIEFDDPPAKFVVSPNSPVKQIWVSAHSKSYKLDWDAARGAFLINGQSLNEMVAEAISKRLGETVTL